ncbi:MAG: cupin [Acidobacteria bacterium CG_4_9_14_3_um_filter_49_7]|nr:MAG: cupin [Acidobacteria bacterium CG_4_9_14_3_um_filter_49_7]
MLVKPYTELKPEKVEMEGTVNTTIRWLIAEKEGASNFFMRLFEVEPGGHTPFHSHPGEHEIFILDGKGNLNSESGPKSLLPGTFAFVPGGEKHQFENTGSQPLKFLCIIPSDY